MTNALVILLLLAALAFFWSDARTAAECAHRHASIACQQAGVLLLDHTVSLEKIALRRDEEGRIRFWRRFRYEYSTAGDDRQRGALALIGNRLTWLQAPLRASREV